ncbi:hypothetical protein TTHERM_000170529 (macronuclear) [Tetrahymena thermophila SB210]|uniref:Uncharacterized protein n=1 Tax=Tetrahymena thermophila (strain SB210) TaxID=312017 RepID=W7XGP0_TETTS|nr:hypothetical protein TTHERM_000170529 [Tetrahymena thermophila SB210]EWS76198.1 hypothetical protein TTHERM_000170529 [Tetrahymena thermophila SB210]|eukprot:XP_012651245.1 hypothetical protein TTHERM_000170529 [Tetrahymena thermophila SB210]
MNKSIISVSIIIKNQSKTNQSLVSFSNSKFLSKSLIKKIYFSNINKQINLFQFHFVNSQFQIQNNYFNFQFTKKCYKIQTQYLIQISKQINSLNFILLFNKIISNNKDKQINYLHLFGCFLKLFRQFIDRINIYGIDTKSKQIIYLSKKLTFVQIKFIKQLMGCVQQKKMQTIDKKNHLDNKEEVANSFLSQHTELYVDIMQNQIDDKQGQSFCSQLATYTSLQSLTLDSSYQYKNQYNYSFYKKQICYNLIFYQVRYSYQQINQHQLFFNMLLILN